MKARQWNARTKTKHQSQAYSSVFTLLQLLGMSPGSYQNQFKSITMHWELEACQIRRSDQTPSRFFLWWLTLLKSYKAPPNLHWPFPLASTFLLHLFHEKVKSCFVITLPQRFKYTKAKWFKMYISYTKSINCSAWAWSITWSSCILIVAPGNHFDQDHGIVDFLSILHTKTRGSPWISSRKGSARYLFLLII